MYTNVTEISDGVFCLCVSPVESFSYNSFLLVDEKIMLIHTGRHKFFDTTLSLASSIVSPERLDWITFSHFEADECGALNLWLRACPKALPLVGPIGRASIEDFSVRTPKCISDNEEIVLGSKRIRALELPHFPHGWDAMMFFEESAGILFCSDFAAQGGRRAPITSSDLSDDIVAFQKQFGFLTEGIHFEAGLKRITELDVNMLATQHGSVICGKGVNPVLCAMEEFCKKSSSIPDIRRKIGCSDF